MRQTPNPLVEPFRILQGRLASDESFGNNGMFLIPMRGGKVWVQVIASDGMDWDHVSVVPVDRNSAKLWRTPTWDEMCAVKALFFGDDETVIEFHPPKRVYRNAHEYCLHLWRPQLFEMPLPDPIMVAPEGRSR